MDKITLKNFGPYNRERRIGSSLYRIGNRDPYHASGEWYILEIYNNGDTFIKAKGCYNSNLENVIERINHFSKEGEIALIHFKST